MVHQAGFTHSNRRDTKHLESLWRTDLYAAFRGPAAREVSPGAWTLCASVAPDDAGGDLPAYFLLEGAFQQGGGDFLYRDVLVGFPRQAALLRTVHPDWPLDEVLRHLVYAELRTHGTDRLPEEGATLLTGLRTTQGPVLLHDPQAIPIHPTTYAIEYRTDGAPPTEYRTYGWRGQPGQLEAFLAQGGQESPVVVFLNRTRATLMAQWKAGLRREAYASLLDRLDMPALGGALFEWACREGETALAEKLLAKGLPPGAPAADGSYPVIAACGSGNRALIQKLLDAGARLDVADGYGCSPLAEACATGDADLVEWLVRSGAKARYVQGPDWETPFLIALGQPSLRVLKAVLTSAGPLPDRLKAADPIDFVAFASTSEMALWLLDQGCRPTLHALVRACERGDAVALERLLAVGLDPNGEMFGRTPLMAAVEGGHGALVERLLAKGADPQGKGNRPGVVTPLQRARELGNAALVKVLEGARPSR